MLYIFVEGDDDSRFISNFSRVQETIIIEYASDKKEKTTNFIKSIKSMPYADYLFLADSDGKSIDDTKTYIKSIYANVDTEKIIVVQYEIQSWYYAGLSRVDHDRLKFKKYMDDTNSLTKEAFYSKLPRFSERIYYMQQILKYYNISQARKRNRSINSFFDTIAT